MYLCILVIFINVSLSNVLQSLLNNGVEYKGLFTPYSNLTVLFVALPFGPYAIIYVKCIT